MPPKGEHCTQVLEANLGDIIEIRFVGAENPRVDNRRLMWTYHTAHLHGYDMFLLDMGFPVTNKTGQIMKMNSGEFHFREFQYYAIKLLIPFSIILYFQLFKKNSSQCYLVKMKLALFTNGMKRRF